MGFPSPADGYAKGVLGLRKRDVLVFDRTIEPEIGTIVVAAGGGEFTVQKYVRCGNRAALLTADPERESIEFIAGHDRVV